MKGKKIMQQQQANISTTTQPQWNARVDQVQGETLICILFHSIKCYGEIFTTMKEMHFWKILDVDHQEAKLDSLFSFLQTN